MTSKERIEELCRNIQMASQSYYTGQDIMEDGRPLPSDAEFDKWVDELRLRDKDNPLLHRVGWGYDISKVEMIKVGHKYGEVGSLDKVKKVVDARVNLDDRVVVTPKIDGGVSVVAYYDNGVLVDALTRGDGTTGLRILDKMSRIIPNNIPDFGKVSVRGDVMIPIEVWKEKYPDQPSPRNLAAGIINRKYDWESYISDCVFMTYKIHGGDIIIEDKIEVLDRLKYYRFCTVPHKIIFLSSTTDDQMEEYIKELSSFYGSYTCPVDGLVLTNLKFEITKSGFYNYQEIAYKTISDSAICEVKRVNYNFTRTSAYKPTVELTETVRLSGADIGASISASNASIVKEMGLGPGAIVEVIRSGEIIPIINKVIKPVEPQLPTHCEKCHEPLIWRDRDLACGNPECPNIEYQRLWHWGYEIGFTEGFGDGRIGAFFDYFKIQKVEDLYKEDYRLRKDDLYNIPNYGDYGVEKCLEWLNQLYRKIDEAYFMYGLSIPMVGWESCKKVALYGIEKIIDNVDNVENIEGITYRAKDEIRKYHSVIKHLYEIVKPCKYVDNTDNSTNDNLIKYTVVITGKLSKTRNELISEFSSKKVRVFDEVTKEVDYLVTDNFESNSSKARAARDLGIKFISESDFRKLIEQE